MVQEIRALIMEPSTARPTRPGIGNLVKESVASALKDAIVQGRLEPGQRVIEGKWARELGVAQASVREAINLLTSDGFLVKDAGRSARVVRYSEDRVARMYEIRGALEGLAAQLAAESQADLSEVEAAAERMADAARRADMKAIIESDLAFHLALAEASGNPVLAAMVRRLLTPLFAFVLLRVLKSGQGPDAWSADLPRHRRMIEIVREGDGAVAGQYVKAWVGRFAASAYQVWENVGGSVQAHTRGQKKGRARPIRERRQPV